MTIITQLIEFILFKREVKDIAYNPMTATLIFIVYIAMTVFAGHNANATPVQGGAEPLFTHIPIMFWVVVALSFTGFYYTLFAAQEKQSRFTQTLTAYYGSSVILSVVALTASLIPAGIFIVLLAQAMSFVCAVRATMQALEYSVFRAFFSIIGITMLAVLIGFYTFTPVVNEAATEAIKQAQ